jgi:hypothetical protein
MKAKVEKKIAKEIRRKEFGYRSLAVKRQRKNSASQIPLLEEYLTHQQRRNDMCDSCRRSITSTSSWRRNHPFSSFVVMWQLIQTLKNAASRTR